MARKFGIEVEFGGNCQTLLVSLVRAGLASEARMHGYTGHNESFWIVKPDASVSGGGELVSPPLDWDNADQRGQVKRAFACLAEAGCRPIESAGVHVHVDASDLSPKQIGAVARTFTKYEDQIFRIATSGWQTMRRGGSTYCKPLERAKVEKIAKAQTREQLGRAYFGSQDFSRQATNHSDSARYYGLNLHSWFYRGTVEFRVFNSTCNAKRAEAYITLCMAIVQDARDGKQRSINKVFALGDMASKEGADKAKEEKRQLHHLCQMLRWENETSPISKEDLDLVTYVWKNSTPQRNFSSPSAW